jgi:RHS repeat-associated protein
VGNLVAEQDALPFGTALTPASGGANPLFTSYDRSTTTGLDYAANRFYDPALGRFASTDPLALGASSPADPRSANMYAYVRNDPVNATDPLGLRWYGLTGCIQFDNDPIRCTTQYFPEDESPPASPTSGDGGGGGSGGGGAANQCSRGNPGLLVNVHNGLANAPPGSLAAHLSGLEKGPYVPGPRPTTQLDMLFIGVGGAYAAVLGGGIAMTAGGETLGLTELISAANSGGKLGRLFGLIRTGFQAASPSSAGEAFSVIESATGAMGLEPGIASLGANGSIILNNVGGIVTTLGATGSILIQKGGETLLKLCQ